MAFLSGLYILYDLCMYIYVYIHTHTSKHILGLEGLLQGLLQHSSGDRGILLVTSAFSHLLPSALQGLQRCAVPRRVLRGHFVTRLFERWTWHGTACVIGKFCQVTFPTMANVGLSPMMCYKHPGRHPRPRPQEQLGTVRNSGQERH